MTKELGLFPSKALNTMTRRMGRWINRSRRQGRMPRSIFVLDRDMFRNIGLPDGYSLVDAVARDVARHTAADETRRRWVS